MNKIIRAWADRKPGKDSDGTVKRDGDILMCNWHKYPEYQDFVIAAFAPSITDDDVLLLRHEDDCPAYCAAIRDEAEFAAAYHKLIPMYCLNPAAETDREHTQNACEIIRQALLGGDEDPDNAYLYCHLFGIDIPTVYHHGEEVQLPSLTER